MQLKRLLAGTILTATLGMGTAHAAVTYSLDTINTAGFGAGPYATVTVSRTDPTHANISFTRVGSYTFGEMGLSVNASAFTSSAVSFILAPTSNQTPTYTANLGGGLDGFGNFALDQVANPAGFSSSVIFAAFTLTDTSGTWSSDSNVLGAGNSQGHQAAAHVFNAATGGNSAFAAGGPTDPVGVPEPASLALLGFGLLGLGFVRGRPQN